MKLVDDAICNFKKETEEIIIPNWLILEIKTFTIQLSYLNANEKWFIKGTGDINNKGRCFIIWNTPNIQSLFNNRQSKAS